MRSRVLHTLAAGAVLLSALGASPAGAAPAGTNVAAYEAEVAERFTFFQRSLQTTTPEATCLDAYPAAQLKALPESELAEVCGVASVSVFSRVSRTSAFKTATALYRGHSLTINEGDHLAVEATRKRNGTRLVVVAVARDPEPEPPVDTPVDPPTGPPDDQGRSVGIGVGTGCDLWVWLGASVMAVEGEVFSYSWTAVGPDGTEFFLGTDKEFIWYAPAAGTYHVTVTVTDDDGVTGTSTRDVTAYV